MPADSLLSLFRCAKCDHEPLVGLTAPGPLAWQCPRCETRYRYDERSQRLQADG